jgi:hypothetical protein
VKGLSSSRGDGDTLLLWLATIAVACAGYYIAFVALAGAIDTQHEMTARVADAIRTNAEVLAQRPALEREAETLDKRMRDLDLRADRAALVARFVQTAARVAGERGVTIDRVEGRTAIAAPLPPSAAPQNSSTVPFEPIPLEVTLDGTYNALLATIRELALAPLPMQIEIAAIERAGPGGTAVAAPLTARLHLVLQHVSDAGPDGAALPHSP